MRPQRSHRVLFDSEAFVRHRRSGITRYFAELIREYQRPDIGVVAVTPYTYVANAHLVDAVPGQYRQIPLPGGVRARALDRLNRRATRTAEPADVVHHSIYEPSALETWQAPKRVATVYDFTLELRPDLFGEATAAKALTDKQMFLQHCDVVLSISETTSADLRRFIPGLDKPVIVTPLGAADQFFSPRKVSIRNLPERYVLHVGNRHAHKNVDVLFRAFAELSRRDPTLHLVLSGNGLSGESDRLRELGIDGRTVSLHATDVQLPWLYRSALAFVFPSVYEGFGLPVVEAMAAGCPVVLADTPALIEVADDAAAVFAPDDVETLVAHLEAVLSDSARADAMRAAGARRAAQFTWRRTAELTASAYDLVAGQ